MSRLCIAGLLFAVISEGARAQDLSEVLNYRELSPLFASSGQPTETQFEAIRDSGFERIVNLAFSTDRRAVAGEDELVRSLGMDYVQIPVVFEAPTAADFATFAAVMQRDPGARTLLHCQVNWRASAFAFLYRVLFQNVPVADAKADLDAVWAPNATWQALIFEVLEANAVSPHCAGCVWAE